MWALCILLKLLYVSESGFMSTVQLILHQKQKFVILFLPLSVRTGHIFIELFGYQLIMAL